MNKKIISILGIILALPLVSGATQVFAALDLFSLLVEHVFGNLLFAGFGLTVFFLIICMFSRMSRVSLIFLIGLWVMVFSMGYFGALAAVPIFIAAFYYFVYGVLNFINSLT